MKKIFLINLLAFSVLCVAIFIATQNDKPACNLQCASGDTEFKSKEIRFKAGAEADDRLFQFNRVYIKI